MRFEWDENKNNLNQRKHRISFELAQDVFNDPFARSRLGRIVNGEERWITMGLVGKVIVLVVAHTFVEKDGEEIIRMISARKATKKERAFYEEG